MNIEQLSRDALNKLKSKWDLPKKGFIAGGSLANTIWELVSGKEAVINDIDVFILRNIINVFNPLDRKSLYRFKKEEKTYHEDYSGITFSQKSTRSFYLVATSEREGIFNYVEYDSNRTEPQFILDSFDLNCVGVGYSIEEDKFYWTENFKEFLKTGKIKVVNGQTPSHTAIRIGSKEIELGAKVDEEEWIILSHLMSGGYGDINKRLFKERYRDKFLSSPHLSEIFQLEEDDYYKEYIKIRHGEDVNLWKLSPIKYKGYNSNNSLSDLFQINNYWVDDNITSIHDTCDLLFYLRNVKDNPILKDHWKDFHFNRIDYMDGATREDKDFILNLGKWTTAMNSLDGLKLVEQVEITKKLINEFSDDPIIAISLLEKGNFKLPEEFDESTKLLLELSVRKEIVNDTKGKVRKILGEKETN
jgi:hypothetical protein